MAISRKKNKVSVPALFLILDASISKSDLELVKKVTNNKQDKNLFLVVKSFGGDAYSAVRIIKHLHTKFNTIVGVVPDYAYSAASLLLLGTNKILISPEGYIAPIDKPMEHSSTADSISALDMTQSVTNLSSLVKQTAISFYKSMRGPDPDFTEPINKTDALDISWKSSVEIIKPLIEKVDPIILQKCYRDLKIGLYYGADLLNDRMFPDERVKSFTISTRLVHAFPSHGYAIFRDELRNELGLKIDNFEENKHHEKLSQKYNELKSGIVYLDDIYA